MIKIAPISILLIALSASPASATCYSWQKGCQSTVAGGVKAGERWKITNAHRQRLGDIYNPGHGRRLQIRDTHRRIVGYIEPDGTVTNTRRQEIGGINLD
jgi:hypothetical protein